MNGEPETVSDDRRNTMVWQTTDPVTVRLYGFKDVTLPAYLLLLTATVVVVAGLMAVSAEAASPGTDIGRQLHRWACRTPPAIEIAIWAPPVLLAGLAFEVLECTVVLLAFRQKKQARNPLPGQSADP